MCPSHTVTFLDLVLNFGYQLEHKIRRYAFEEEKETKNKKEGKTRRNQDKTKVH